MKPPSKDISDWKGKTRLWATCKVCQAKIKWSPARLQKHVDGHFARGDLKVPKPVEKVVEVTP